jgi:S1-C subfamily serine protease
MVKIERKHLPAAQFGSATALKKGEQVAALGAPLGLEHSVTRGSVGNPAREHEGRTYVQIDAALNPGNSGGPLINADGLVVGMSTMVADKAQNVGFAIPAEDICSFLDDNTVGYSAALTTGAAKPPAKAEAKPAAKGETEKGGKGKEGEKEAETPAGGIPGGLWTVVLVSAAISLVLGVLAGSLAARAAVRNLARQVMTTGRPAGTPGPPAATPGEDLSDVDIQLY